jgi:hypothetical protein
LTRALDRIPVASITAQAREVHAGRTLLTLLAGLFFLVGWVAFRVAAVAWLALVWCAVATREGWREAKRSEAARKVSRGPARAG